MEEVPEGLADDCESESARALPTLPSELNARVVFDCNAHWIPPITWPRNTGS